MHNFIRLFQPKAIQKLLLKYYRKPNISLKFYLFQMSTPKFELSTIKYENISNRMERLRHSSSQNHVSSHLLSRSASVERLATNGEHSRYQNVTLNRNPITSTQAINQRSFVTLLPRDESCLDGGAKCMGRVTKNTGIRKYNQRMLKQIGNINRDRKLTTPTKYTTPEKYTTPQKIKVNEVSRAQVLVKQAPKWTSSINYSHINRTIQSPSKQPPMTAKPSNASNYQRIRLQPGKIYTREQLQIHFGY